MLVVRDSSKLPRLLVLLPLAAIAYHLQASGSTGEVAHVAADKRRPRHAVAKRKRADAESLAKRVARYRRAAALYTPDAFDDADALPDTYDAGRNPCWVGPDGAGHCLPAFHILGVYQSAASDLFERLSLHPAVARGHVASPSFYSQVHPNWHEYVRNFAPSLRAARGRGAKLLGEASAITYHFVWVHQEKFNQPYVKAMGAFWKRCRERPPAEQAAVPHRDCMSAHMAEGRAADAATAAKAGVRLQPPTLMRAVYGANFEPKLIVLFRLPWERLHAAFYNYPHYRRKFGDGVGGERAWIDMSISAFRRCEARFGAEACALSFESLDRDNEETFYHCDQLIKGLYSAFLPHWQKEFSELLYLRSEDYFRDPKTVLSRTMHFLGLSVPQTDESWQPFLKARRVVHGTRPPAGKPPLDAENKLALQMFYAPSLEELVVQLQDEPDAAQWREWTHSD